MLDPFAGLTRKHQHDFRRASGRSRLGFRQDLLKYMPGDDLTERALGVPAIARKFYYPKPNKGPRYPDITNKKRGENPCHTPDKIRPLNNTAMEKSPKRREDKQFDSRRDCE